MNISLPRRENKGNEKMKFLIVGLGSMGKRRIRGLKALGYDTSDIAGFDTRDDRRTESEQKYSIKTYKDIEKALRSEKPSAMIISVPPENHYIYMELALKKRINFFVEASVLDTHMDAIKEKLKKINIIGVPSCTVFFHPAIKIILDQLHNNNLGNISNIVYHVGQYLPDWHTYESVSDFYVSNPASGGARELVPFELTWFTKIFGFPKRVCGNHRKTINITGAEKIDDTYNFLLDYTTFLASFTIDVVSRYTTRRFLINGDKKQLRWDWDDNSVKIFDPEIKEWQEISYQIRPTEEGYHPKINENMYIDEIKSFINAIEKKEEFVNNLENDHRVLKLLYAIEESDRKSSFITL